MYYEIEDEVGNVSTIQIQERFPEELLPIPQTGDLAPLFYLKSEEGFPVTSLTGVSASNDSRSLIELLQDKPLVLTFYCTCWGSYAPKYLTLLQEIGPKIEALGGQLIVLTSESNKQITKLVRRLETDLTIFHDRDRQVARSYGVYSETSPIWDRIAGISEEVFTPSLFIIGKDRRISYAFLDENFDSFPDVKKLLRTIYSDRGSK